MTLFLLKKKLLEGDDNVIPLQKKSTCNGNSIVPQKWGHFSVGGRVLPILFSQVFKWTKN